MKKSILLIFATLIVANLTPLTAQAQEPSTGDGIVVDGNILDWDLGADYFADMYMAGNPTRLALATLYLRYDCSTQMLNLLVLDVPEDGLCPDEDEDEAWVKIYGLGWSGNKLIDGEGNGNTSPRTFEWVYDDEDHLIGYEASAYLETGSYAEFEAHLNVSGETASTGKRNRGWAIPLSLNCERTAESVDLPGTHALQQNYPNPFNPSTTIQVELAGTGPATLAVYDLAGRQVAELQNGLLAAGTHSFVFDASGLTSGVYFYSLAAGGITETRRMVLLK